MYHFEVQCIPGLVSIICIPWLSEYCSYNSMIYITCSAEASIIENSIEIDSLSPSTFEQLVFYSMHCN